ncbi:MAG: hypothetical protein A2Y25_08325 [Candidatus Melainabacteria bacterium GWF2_37_15]|nr:MAG: hypothetical protein A2Y25_08325 [Candidatus Melainabacteria bacterium GWF2_37_15]
MKSVRNLVLALILICGITVTFNGLASSSATNGLNIAVVDVQELVKNYGKVNILKEKQTAKLTDLQKFVENARKNIAAEKDTIKKKLLEDKYNKELQTKKNTIDTEYQKQLVEINKSVEKAINTVAQANKYDLVLTKNSVLYGGKNVTKDVLKVLK